MFALSDINLQKANILVDLSEVYTWYDQRASPEVRQSWPEPFPPMMVSVEAEIQGRSQMEKLTREPATALRAAFATCSHFLVARKSI